MNEISVLDRSCQKIINASDNDEKSSLAGKELRRRKKALTF